MSKLRARITRFYERLDPLASEHDALTHINLRAALLEALNY